MSWELLLAIGVNIVVGVYAWSQTRRAADRQQRLEHIGDVAQRLYDKTRSLERQLDDSRREVDRLKAVYVREPAPFKPVVLPVARRPEMVRSRGASPFMSNNSPAVPPSRLDDILPIPAPSSWASTVFADRDDCREDTQRATSWQADATRAECPAPSPAPEPAPAPAPAPAADYGSTDTGTY